ncbi:hypothetical protein POM88_029844 [Heracleum sosnowskyi]|uniref:Malectin-like domain-containing protein n=1 Tax=Heracleum sosnowskyi TaxID=360622 RepID=A0AAD8MHJ0_9APIA|nr:hypothetical protein POM88_029844 [Heracleum sosnowskyi]
MDTFRVFTTRKKNCNAFNADKGGRILVRASFNYGNYDKKSSPPTFDLQFDGNFWTTVETSIDEVVTYEATYIVKGDVVLETLHHIECTPIYIAITLADNPPQEVLQSAIATSSTSDKLMLASGFPSNVVSVYLTMYFSEPTEVTETRSFKLYIDNQANSDSIIPTYEVAQEIAVSSNTMFSMVATTDSALPPLINAMELFYVSTDQLTDGTHTDDLAALDSLQQTFTNLQDWYGDPCLPVSFTWDWLECSNDTMPRVTALHLGSFDLTGSLPDISSMTSLQTIVTGNPDLCTSGKSCDATTTTTTNTPGFPTITGSPSTGKKKNKETPVILGATIPSGLLASAFARPLLKNRENICHMVDPALQGQYPAKSLYKAFATALLCVQEQPSKRPRVSDVVKALDHIVSQPYTPQSHPSQTTPEILVVI